LHTNITLLKRITQLRTLLSLGLDRLTHRNTRRTLALSVAGVDAVDLHALTLGCDTCGKSNRDKALNGSNVVNAAHDF
jgi:hypothetical protein